MSHLNSSMYRQMPWKNGLGVTTEIARAPREGDFAWRASIAQVTADGPFSTFPGCDRVILTLEGEGMILTQPDTATEVTLALLEPWSFSGDVATNCMLRDGPIRDFNIIARRAAFVPAVSVLRPATQQRVDLSGQMTILYCAAGSLIVETPRTFELAREETVVIELAAGESERMTIRPSAAQTVIIQAVLSLARPGQT